MGDDSVASSDPAASLRISSGYSGPLPPPGLLRQFNQVVPGLAERIIDLAEKEADHRRSIELQQLSAHIEDMRAARAESRLGQVFGLTIGIVAIVSGAITASLGAEWPGSLIGGGGVIGLVAVFVLGRVLRNRDEASDDGSAETED